MCQEKMVHFVKIQKDLKRMVNLAARIKNANVEVIHAIRTLTGEIVVMNLYQMVLYVKAVQVFDRDFSETDMSDNMQRFYILATMTPCLFSRKTGKIQKKIFWEMAEQLNVDAKTTGVESPLSNSIVEKN